MSPEPISTQALEAALAAGTGGAGGAGGADIVALAGWVALALAGLAGSALCSGAELGAYSVNRVRLDLRASRRPADPLALTLRAELEKPDRLLATLLIFSNIFGYLASVGVTQTLARMGYADAWVLVINVLILAPGIFLLGDALPKELFRLEADRLTYAVAPVLRLMRLTAGATGLLGLLGALARVVEAWAGLRREDTAISEPRQRIAAMLREGASAGALSASQASLVDRAMRLRQSTVETEMVPWSLVRPLGAEWDRARIISAVAAKPHSRYPVVDRAGRVVGILNQMDLHLRPAEPVSALLTPVVRLAPRSGVIDALATMHRAGARLAVVESDGRPVGLVSTKDLVEPLTGELADL